MASALRPEAVSKLRPYHDDLISPAISVFIFELRTPISDLALARIVLLAWPPFLMSSVIQPRALPDASSTAAVAPGKRVTQPASTSPFEPMEMLSAFQRGMTSDSPVELMRSLIQRHL